MAVTSFAGSDAAFIYSGKWGTPFSNAGITIKEIEGAYSEVRVNFTGTDARLRVFASGHTFRWKVDGGSEQTASPGGNVNDWITIATGLSDTTHTLVLYSGKYYGYSPDMLEVTGSAPAIAAPSGYVSTQYRIADSSGLSLDGSRETFANEGYDEITDSRVSFRFKATTATIRVWCIKDNAAGRIGLCIDGDPDSLVFATPGDTWGWASFTGLDSGAEHTYRVITYRSYCYSLMFPSGTLNTTALTAFPADYWIGDSITQGTGIDYSTGTNYPELYALMADRGYQVNGNPGEAAFGFGQTHATDPGNASPEPDRVIIGWGFNDQSGGSGVDTTEFRTAVEDIVDQALADLPTARVYWYGILPVSAATNRASYNAEIAGYETALGNPSFIYVNTDSLATVSTGDGTHPDNAGARDVSDFLLTALDENAGGAAPLPLVGGGLLNTGLISGGLVA